MWGSNLNLEIYPVGCMVWCIGDVLFFYPQIE